MSTNCFSRKGFRLIAQKVLTRRAAGFNATVFGSPKRNNELHDEG